MKRVIGKLILTVLIVMLWGCSNEAASDGMKNELVKGYGFEMEEELKAYISDHFDCQQDYAMGNGIVVLDLDKSSRNELKIFPVYCNDELIFLIEYGQEMVYLTDPEVLDSIEEDQEYLIVKAEEKVFYVSNDKLLLMDGEGKELSDKMDKKIGKIREGSIERNLMGIEKRAIRILSQQDPEPEFNEGDYRNDRIIIRFTSDNVDSKIRMYEAFCHGKVQGTFPGDNIYVFCFDPLDSKNLQILLDASNGLSYVLSASLDERIDNVEPVEGLEME